MSFYNLRMVSGLNIIFSHSIASLRIYPGTEASFLRKACGSVLLYGILAHTQVRFLNTACQICKSLVRNIVGSNLGFHCRFIKDQEIDHSPLLVLKRRKSTANISALETWDPNLCDHVGH